MPINSCAKGKRGERAWRDFLRAVGVSARRGRQFSGSPDSPDVVSDDGFHWEVKWVENLNIWKAMAQAVHDAGKDKIPAVAFKKNGTNWMICMRAEDLQDFIHYKALLNRPSPMPPPLEVKGQWVTTGASET